MSIVSESQAAASPSYIHLAYVSAETAATCLLSAGIILGLVILARTALETCRSRAARRRASEASRPNASGARKDLNRSNEDGSFAQCLLYSIRYYLDLSRWA